MHVLAIKNDCAVAAIQKQQQKPTQRNQRRRRRQQEQQQQKLATLSDANETTRTAMAVAEAAATAKTEQFNNYRQECKEYNNSNNGNMLTAKLTTSSIEKSLATTTTTTTAAAAAATTTATSRSTNWRRRRRRREHMLESFWGATAAAAAAAAAASSTTKANNDNCNYSYNNNFNKINKKLLLITSMLLITMTATMTICQIEATPVAAADTARGAAAATTLRTISSASSFGGSYGGAGGRGGGSISTSPLSALLKSGGASYIKPAAAAAAAAGPVAGSPTTQRQLQQQQLFAMLTKNSLGHGNVNVNGNGGISAAAAAAAAAYDVGGVAAAKAAAAATSGRHFFMLHADDDENEDIDDDNDNDNDDNNNNNNETDDVGDATSHMHVPTDLLSPRHIEVGNVVIPPPLAMAAGSLETTGFVADDGMQYEKAERALAAAGATTTIAAHTIDGNNNNNNNNCPKECKCLNVYFDCGKLHLDRVPVLPNYVQILDLVGNKLNDTTVLDITNLPELHKLSLKRNQLDVLPKFVGLTALKQLNLANNRIQRISSEALGALPKLKSLDLSKNYLHVVEANWFPKPNRLGHLILNGNEIASVDEHAFELLNDLVDLELNSNRLLSLPGGVFKNLTKLKKLSLNFNHLEINWSTFRGLLSLQKLFLKSNNIRTLQDGVFHVMRNIETIELDHNGISTLSRQGLFNLTKLHHLSLSNNSIAHIEPDTWEFTQSLEMLDLSHNNISEFKPQHLDCLQRLKQLNLAHNKIQYLMENTFDCVKNLEDLNLRRNRLAWVIEDPNASPPFKALRKLKKLDLYGNNLKQINSKSLNGLSNLEQLNLGGNALATIQIGAFQHMAHLQKLIFKSLNFICDCELLGFKQFLQAKFANNAQLQANVVCGYPEHLLDRELQMLNAAELTCADSPKPVLKQEPSNILAVKGTNITMECIAHSPTAASLAAADELKIRWRHNNQNVRERPTAMPYGAYSATETRVHHEANTNQTTIVGYLRLYNVSYESAGGYQCVVSNAFGTTYSQSFKISIGTHPTFLRIPSNLTIDAGETARLVCSATGEPMPEIALQKFGASDFPAATERRLQVIREENAFLITNSKPSDTGIYTCTAVSAAGEIKINATLVVNDKPLPAIPIIRKKISLGTDTVLECLNDEVTAELIQPQREWYKENKPFHISSTSYSERYYFTTDKELLVIVNTQENDAGHYRCEITDNSKTLTLQMELAVLREESNQNIIILCVIVVTVACVLFGACIIWSILYYQVFNRKLALSSANQQRSMVSLGRMPNGSRGSTLDQTQLTTLNRTYVRAAQNMQPEQAQNDVRECNLTDMNFQPEQRSRLIVTASPNYQQRLASAEALAFSYLQHNDLNNEHPDHLSSKDSGTGSDAAVKRSIEDFSIALLPTASTPTPTSTMTTQRQALVVDEDVDDDDDGDESDADLQYAPTRALGVSEVYDDVELYELGRSAEEQQRFLQNSNHNYDGGGGGGNDSVGVGSTSAVGRVGVVSAVGGGAVGLPSKCSTQLSTNYNSIKQASATTVDI